MRAYGVDVWLDENELELGAVLTRDLKDAIHGASHVLVIASHAAAASKWVGDELKYAREVPFRKPVVIPIFVGDTEKHPRFKDFLGKDFKTRHLVDAGIADLARVLTDPGTPCNERALNGGLAALRSEVPALAPIIGACLGEVEMPWSQLDRLKDPKIAFDDLEFALTSGYEAAPPERRRVTAEIAAYAFRFRGAGSRVIQLDLAAQTAGCPASDGSALRIAVSEPIARDNLDAAISLLAGSSPPNDHALAGFTNKNFDLCDDHQRTGLVRLMTAPRRGPGGFARDAAYALYSRMPKNHDLRQLWWWWISIGRFEGRERDDAVPSDLLYWMGEGVRKEATAWQSLLDVLYDRVRSLARSRDKSSVTRALDYLIAAADRHFPRLDVVCRAVEEALGSAEWNSWEHKSEMSALVFEFLDAANGDKNWSRAWQDFEKSWAAAQRVNELRRRHGLPLI